MSLSCTEGGAKGGGGQEGASAPLDLSKNIPYVRTTIRKYLECFTLLDAENKHKLGKKRPGPTEIEGK